MIFFSYPTVKYTKKVVRYQQTLTFCRCALLTKSPDSLFRPQITLLQTQKRKKSIIQQASVVQTILLDFVHIY